MGLDMRLPVTRGTTAGSRGRGGPLRIQRKGNAGRGGRDICTERGVKILNGVKVCVKCETEGGKALRVGRGED